MQEVLKFAVDKNADYKDYPEDWLWQWRVEGAKAPDSSGTVKIAKVAGRTTYYFENWQKKYV